VVLACFAWPSEQPLSAVANMTVAARSVEALPRLLSKSAKLNGDCFIVIPHRICRLSLCSCALRAARVGQCVTHTENSANTQLAEQKQGLAVVDQALEVAAKRASNKSQKPAILKRRFPCPTHLAPNLFRSVNVFSFYTSAINQS